jgi:pimeloyl-ACP methyl ester carboxylesterase
MDRVHEPYKVVTGDAQDAPVVIFLHGAGQAPKNGVLERLSNGLRKEGVTLHIISLPHERDPGAVEKFLKQHSGPVLIAGHSAGGAKAMRYAERYPDRIRGAILVNPAAFVGHQPVPTLLLRGTNDAGGHWQEGGDNVTVYRMEGGDHSLRYRPYWNLDRSAAEGTAETHAMNRAVAQQVGDFLKTLKRE